jgi:autotransporter-associated beta strand protein
LIKTGSSNLVLAANNTYSGLTTVSNGVLKLTAAGSISNSPIITVSSGAVFDVSAYTPYTLTNQILAGNGVVTGSVVVADGAGVSGGDTSGTGQLSFSNNLTLSPGAVVHSYYNAITNNGINVAGTLSLPTVATVQVTQVSGSLPSSYVLFTFGTGAGEASSDRSLSGWVITGGRSYSQAIVNNGQVKLVSPTGMIVEIY